MPHRKFAEAPTITIGTKVEFDEAVAQIALLEAQERDGVAELQLAALLEATDDYIRRHIPPAESRDLAQWREKQEGRKG